jgi:iron(II)-dependent oxidoreductase
MNKFFITIMLVIISSLCLYSQELPVTVENHGEMILIPEGEFIMGCNQDEIHHSIDILGGSEEWYILEYPKYKLAVKSYYIDKLEVTNSQYCEFLNEKGNQQEDEAPWLQIGSKNCLIYQDGKGKFTPKKGYENYPVIMVSWTGARAYSKWAGKRLPTEVEWEKAARGIKGICWPWGNTWNSNKCNNWKTSNKELKKLMAKIYNNKGPLPVGSIPEGKSPYGVLDMAGNVSEWCSDWYGLYPGYPFGGKDYHEFTHKVTRGGSWGIEIPGGLTCAYRSLHKSYACDSYTGFRCVMDLPSATPVPKSD